LEENAMIMTMAMRNLGRQKRRSLLLGSAVAFAVLVICLSSGITAGMNKAVQDNITLATGGHVLVTGSLRSASGRIQTRMRDDGSMAKAIAGRVAGLRSVSPLVSVQANLVFGSREQQIILRGVDWSEDRLYRENLILAQGSMKAAAEPRAVMLGARAARRFGLGLGDSLLARFSTASGQQNVTEYKLAAVYDDAAAGGLLCAFVGFGDLRSDLNLPEGWCQSLAVFLDDASGSDAAADKVREILAASLPVAPRTPSGTGGPGAEPDPEAGAIMLRVAGMEDLSGQAGAVLGTIRWIGVAVFAIMLVLAAAGIANTYRMVLMERTREIGTLRCIGFRRKHIFRVFVLEAVTIAALGSAAGLAFSFPLGYAAGLLPFSASGGLALALSRGRLIFLPGLPSLALTFGAVIAMSCAAVSGPARRAAALRPAEAMRTIT
jgi:putative ABC transport system permease protein